MLRACNAGWCAPTSAELEWDASAAPRDEAWTACTPAADTCLCLKPSRGSGGHGIRFVRGGVAAVEAVQEEYERVRYNKEALDHVFTVFGGPPRWVVQEYIFSRAVCGGRKFHVHRQGALHNRAPLSTRPTYPSIAVVFMGELCS